MGTAFWRLEKPPKKLIIRVFFRIVQAITASNLWITTVIQITNKQAIASAAADIAVFWRQIWRIVAFNAIDGIFAKFGFIFAGFTTIGWLLPSMQITTSTLA